MKKKIITFAIIVLTITTTILSLNIDKISNIKRMNIMTEALTNDENDSFSCEVEKKYSRTTSEDSNIQYITHATPSSDNITTVTTRYCHAEGDGTLKGSNNSFITNTEISSQTHNKNSCGEFVPGIDY